MIPFITICMPMFSANAGSSLKSSSCFCTKEDRSRITKWQLTLPFYKPWDDLSLILIILYSKSEVLQNYPMFSLPMGLISSLPGTGTFLVTYLYFKPENPRSQFRCLFTVLGRGWHFFRDSCGIPAGLESLAVRRVTGMGQKESQWEWAGRVS